MLTSTSVRRPTLYLHLRLPTQGPTLTLSNHKPTTPQYWTEPVKELCAYISQFHLKGPQLPIVGPGQCQMVQQRQSGAVEELHYMNQSRASVQGRTPPTSVRRLPGVAMDRVRCLLHGQ